MNRVHVYGDYVANRRTDQPANLRNYMIRYRDQMMFGEVFDSLAFQVASTIQRFDVVVEAVVSSTLENSEAAVYFVRKGESKGYRSGLPPTPSK